MTQATDRARPVAEIAAERDANRLLGAAVMLSPRVEIADALLHGPAVPVDRLDRQLVSRLHLVGDITLDVELALRVIASGPTR